MKNNYTTFRYLVDVWQEDGWWLAQVSMGEYGIHMTNAKSEEEIWGMIGDLVLTTKGVKVSWWNKLLWRLRK